MKINKTFAATTHTSFLLSQMCHFVLDYVKSIFPPDFFKRSYVNTADRNINEIKRILNGVDANGGEFAKAVPAIAIHPNFTLDNTIRENPKFDEWFDLGMNPGFGFFAKNRHGYTDIYHDYDEGRFIHSLAKEIKMTFSIHIRAETTMQCWDIMNFIKNRFIFDQFRYVNRVPFIATIPRAIIHNLAIGYQLNLENPEDKAEFNGLFTLHSFNRTGREVHDYSKGHAVYGFDYRCNPLIKFQMPQGDKKTKNNVVTSAEIQFEGEVQTKHFTNFWLEVNDVDEDIGFVNNREDDELSALTSSEHRLLPLPRTLEDGAYETVFNLGIETEPKQFAFDKEIIVHEEKEYLNSNYNPNTARFINRGEYTTPLGWKINTKGNYIITAESLNINDENVWKVSHNFGKYELAMTNGINLIPEKSYKLTLELSNSVRNQIFIVAIHPLGSAGTTIPFRREIHCTYPDRKQKFDIYFGINTSRIGITIRPKDESIENNLNFYSISLKRVDYKKRTTNEYDTVELKEELPKDLLYIIDENIKSGEDNNELFKIKVTEYGQQSFFDNFEMDWERKELKLINPHFGRIYYFSIYAHKGLYEKILEMYKKKYPFLKNPFKVHTKDPHISEH